MVVVDLVEVAVEVVDLVVVVVVADVDLAEVVIEMEAVAVVDLEEVAEAIGTAAVVVAITKGSSTATEVVQTNELNLIRYFLKIKENLILNKKKYNTGSFSIICV